MAAVDLIIVHYESPDELRASLAAVAAGTLRPRRLIVVDNSVTASSRALTLQVCGELGAEALVSDSNVGFGAAVNRAALASDADLLVILNPDAVVEPDTLEVLARHLDANPDVAAASPMILNQAGRVWFAGGRVNPWLARPELAHFAGSPPPATCESSPFVPGCVMAIRRSAFEQVGGFCETFFLYYEDVDLCWRLSDRGWRNELVGTALAHHRRGRDGDPDRNLSPVMLHHTMLSRRKFARHRLSRPQRFVAGIASPLLALRYAYLVARADSTIRGAQWRAIWTGLVTPAR